MDQNNPNDPNSGIGTGTHGDTGTGGTSSGAGYASGGTGTGMNSGGGMTTGSGAGTSGGLGADFGTGGSINPTGGAPIGVTAGSDADRFGSGANVATEGGITGSEGVGGFAGNGGVHGSPSADTPDQFCTHCGHSLSESKGLEQFLGRLGISGDMFGNLRNVDIDEYLNTARDYLKGGTTKVTTYTKENPAKVAAGVAALALGAGLIYAAVNREKGEVTTTATTGFDTNPTPNPNLNADVNFTRGTVGYDAVGDVSVNRTGDLNRGAHGDLGRDAGGTTGYDPNRT